jgi:Flp pilus assembly protein TadD
MLLARANRNWLFRPNKRNCGVCWGPCLLLWVSLIVLVFAVVGGAMADEKTVHLKLPKRSKPTPVQQLNRAGVKAIEGQNFKKARRLFYQAYLLDPNDPFTLNNLGYISELEGDIDRAERYYDLAQQQSSEAAVDMASEQDVQGKPVSKVAGNAAETSMQVNRINVAAINLLLKDRAPEADMMLEKALAIDRTNAFTLNNMGYTKEKEGEYDAALSYYTAAASLRSQQPVVVAVNRDWHGKPISDVAQDNAAKLQKLMKKQDDPASKVARLNLEGVSAMNRNERRVALEYFRQAYKIDPTDAFTLNNMGYVAEMEGDRETADFYYEKARQAKRNGTKVTIATRHNAEGQPVGDVAQTSGAAVDARMQQELEIKRRENAPIELRSRGTNTGPDQPPNDTPSAPATGGNSGSDQGTNPGTPPQPPR